VKYVGYMVYLTYSISTSYSCLL